MKLNELIDRFFSNTKKDIVELAQTELSNENKKLFLDHSISEFLSQAINGLTVNIFVKMILKKMFLPIVPMLTQWVFDLLKAKIDGITK